MFSRTESQTLLKADGTTVPVDSLRTDLEPEPDATEAPPTPRSVPDLAHAHVD